MVISTHSLRVMSVLRSCRDRWLTNREITAMVSPGVSGRAVRNYTREMAAAGVLRQQFVFPEHRYRWAPDADALPVTDVLMSAANAAGVGR